MKGTVKWFNDARGKGVIETDANNEIVVEFSEIRLDGFRSLERGERVEFDLDRSENGGRAKNVRPLERSDSRPLGPERFHT